MKKKYSILIALWVMMVMGTWAQEVPQVTNILNRQTVSLNGDWRYIVDVQEEGYYDYRMNPTPWGFFNNAKPQRPEDLIEYDFDAAPTMHVPGDWNTQDERLFFYEGTVWFQRYFDIENGKWKMENCNAENNSSQPNLQSSILNLQSHRALLYFGAVNYDCHVWVNGKKAWYVLKEWYENK